MKRALVGTACAAVFFLCFSCSWAVAQPEKGSVNPTRIDLGTVYTGSIIEGSFCQKASGGDPNIPFEIVPPPFVKILKKSQDSAYLSEKSRSLGAADSIEATAIFALDTSKAGKFEGAFQVALGTTKVTIPITATIEPGSPERKRVLITFSPFLAGNAPSPDHFKPWTELAAKQQWDVSLLANDPAKRVFRQIDLTKYDTVFLAGDALSTASAREWKRLNQYVESGGRLVMETSRFWGNSVDLANQFLGDKGLRVRNHESEGDLNKTIVITRENIDASVSPNAVSQLRFMRVTPIEVLNTVDGKVLVKAVGIDEKNVGLVVRARYGKGEVIVTGQPLWWNWIGPQWSKGADNDKMLAWMLTPRK
jgi:hypothetical protein